MCLSNLQTNQLQNRWNLNQRSLSYTPSYANVQRANYSDWLASANQLDTSRAYDPWQPSPQPEAYQLRQRVRGVELPTETTPTDSGSDTRIGLQRVGMGLALLGGLQNYRANDAYFSAQSNALNNNIAQTQAMIQQAGERGATAANDARRQGRLTMATQRAGYGASGIAGGDTVNRVQGGTAAAAETNAQRQEYNAMIEQWGLTQNIENMRAQQRSIDLMRRNNRWNSILGTATTLARMYGGWTGVTE